MLFNTKLYIAIKDDSGKYKISEFSLFEIQRVNHDMMNMEIKNYKNKFISFKVSCPLCGEYHYFNYDINELLKRNMVIGGCECVGMPIFYIGKQEAIKERVKKIEQVDFNICSML